MSIINKLKKISYLEIILFILLITLLIQFFFKSNRETFVEERETFIKKTGADVFDPFYVGIYDELLYNEAKDQFEVDHILPDPNTKAVILDIGSGTGHHVNLLSNPNTSVVGIDNSPAMVEIAKKNYPTLDFRVADMLNSMEFSPNTFTHISCLYFTIYYIKDKRLFLENCFKWLKPHGTLILHLVNMKKFDPVLSAASPFVGVSPQSYTPNRITKSTIKFDVFDYKSDFKLNNKINANSLSLDEPNVIFKETIKFKNKKKARINEHQLYMSNQKSILAAARDMGFILQAQYEMAGVEYAYNYLYTLVKPL
jgi:SAM-dependent methyltransferase